MPSAAYVVGHLGPEDTRGHLTVAPGVCRARGARCIGLRGFPAPCDVFAAPLSHSFLCF